MIDENDINDENKPMEDVSQMVCSGFFCGFLFDFLF